MCYEFTHQSWRVSSMGLPHSDMHGLKRICRYPCLIAAYHVLHRLLAPRHPSCALCSLINLILSILSDRGNFVITETLVGHLAAAEFQTQLFKVVFTYCM